MTHKAHKIHAEAKKVLSKRDMPIFHGNLGTSFVRFYFINGKLENK